MKHILVCCGNGVNASTMIEIAVKELCEKNGLDVKISKSYNAEACGLAKTGDLDLIVSNGRLKCEEVPVLVGLPYLTGIGVDKLNSDILAILSK